MEEPSSRDKGKVKGEEVNLNACLLDSEGRGEGSRRPRGTATSAQTLCNIIVSIVGTGVLGLPYAFRVAGWVAGSLGVAIAGLTTFYCMLLLIECRDKIEEEETEAESENHHTYGDLGGKAFGPTGQYLTELLVLVSQAGGSVAYLVFIGQNLNSVFSSPPSLFIFALLLPLEIVLSFIQSLSSLAPFSMFADVCNVLAMAIVIKEDLQLFDHPFSRNAFNGLWGLPFVGGVAVFCFEGFCMTLALEASMAERRKFRWVLGQAFVAITFTYVFFGIFGYLAYGDETRDIITLNLPNNWSAAAVKLGLCIALTFTFPIMMHPIHEIVEAKLQSNLFFQKICNSCRAAEYVSVQIARALVVALLSLVASLIPGFGSFISFVGSTVCALLSFVLPAVFHLTFLGSSIGLFKKAVDYCILVIGLVFAAYGTYDVVVSHSNKS
ncbi:Amino acid transporter ANT1 [Rhynchospora pubera]|uniref:Amino acid transporter ANT1 n=1 Tax=Rhynchospora pubera TaxID=906938 RepID=A0AAV8FT37_9POAL|nr:Amino acid transporter ANT1 [Rhynchospora pubera]KAJ4793973.1 Amino acid transporter ANT1 [Rhynchospora pubera]